jgi:type II secretory pathway pseudopilin PulG
MSGRLLFRSGRIGSCAARMHRRGGTLTQLLVVLGIIFVIIALLLPNFRRAQELERRSQCRSNLKQISVALHEYHDIYGGFPPAYTVDANGKPLHSWRTLILPYMDQQALYDKIDLSKPWDDPTNAEAYATAMDVYHCPMADLEQGQTVYLAVVTAESCLRPTEMRPISEITDGTSNTMVVMEVSVKYAVPWMAPWDADERIVLSPKPDDDLHHYGGSYYIFADTSIQFLSAETETATLRGLITPAGGEVAGEF